jgi:hypothetical protein
MQASFQAILYLFLLQAVGWIPTAAAALVWWTGGCDALFYPLGKHRWDSGHWTWLWWTPVGLITFISSGGCRAAVWLPGWAVIMQAVCGTAASLFIIMRFT